MTLLSRIRDLFTRPPTLEAGDYLHSRVQRELDLEAFTNGYCPDCGSTEFMPGPSAGIAQNLKCSICGHRFNVLTVSDVILAVDRI